jgi:hypothetical protein
MPPRRKLNAVPEATTHPTARDLRDGVADAIANMTWLSLSDRALADLALKLAEQIEETQERRDLLDQLIGEIDGDPGLFKRLQKLEAMCDTAKTVGWLGPQLQGYLRDLGGTPAARKALAPDKPIGGRLAAIRDSLPGARVDDPAAVDQT